MTFMWSDGRAILSLSPTEFEFLFNAVTGGGDYRKECAMRFPFLSDHVCDGCNVLDAMHWMEERKP